MPTTHRRTAGPRAIVVTVLAAVVCIIVSASPAHAHVSPVDASPAPESVITESPLFVRVAFDGPVGRPMPDALEVIHASGSRWDRGPASADPTGNALVVSVDPSMPAGDYEVQYRVASDDGHVESGSYGFSYEPTTPRDLTTPTTPSAPAPSTGAAVPVTATPVTPSTAPPELAAPATGPSEPDAMPLSALAVGSVAATALIGVALALEHRAQRRDS